MTSPGRALVWLAFPILGSLLALVFRPTEYDPYTLEPFDQPDVPEITLALPHGDAIRFIGLPDPSGGVAFWLAETELSPALLRQLQAGPLSHAEAKRLCRLLTDQTGKTLRLPTAAEWRLAARGPSRHAEFPWGYGPAEPPKGLHFNQIRPPSSPGPAFGYGFRDMAGGHWEWTQEATALGGAWSEQNPETLRIDHTWTPPEKYAGLDMGFRPLLEVDVQSSERIQMDTAELP